MYIYPCCGWHGCGKKFLIMPHSISVIEFPVPPCRTSTGAGATVAAGISVEPTWPVIVGADGNVGNFNPHEANIVVYT